MKYCHFSLSTPTAFRAILPFINSAELGTKKTADCPVSCINPHSDEEKKNLGDGFGNPTVEMALRQSQTHFSEIRNTLVPCGPPKMSRKGTLLQDDHSHKPRLPTSGASPLRLKVHCARGHVWSGRWTTPYKTRNAHWVLRKAVFTSCECYLGIRLSGTTVRSYKEYTLLFSSMLIVSFTSPIEPPRSWESPKLLKRAADVLGKFQS